MATFNEVFTITATLADGRTLSMKQSTTYTVTKVFDGTLDRSNNALYGLTSVNQPQLDSEPVFVMFQYQGNGTGNIGLTNTAAGVGTFSLRHDQSVQFHGTEIFETDTSATNSTVGDELSEIDITSSAEGGSVRVIALM